MNSRITKSKSILNLRLVLLLVFCTELHAAVPFFPAYTSSEDVYAVNKLYSALGSPPLSGWSEFGGDPCYELWQGIQCTSNSITAIVLNGVNLGGKLQDDSLANFTSILTLDLSNNFIDGGIPEDLPSTLQTLSLSGNLLTGVLPDAFQSLTQLVSLKVSANKLSGHLPPSMRYLSSLTTMDVQNNEFTGTLEVLQNLPLKDLNIANNQFSGPIPENLLKIPKFQSEGNQLNTTISPSPKQPPATDGPVQQNTPPQIYNPPIYHKKRTVDTKTIAYIVSIGSSLIIAIAILLVMICTLTWKENKNASLKRMEVVRHENTKEPDSANNTTHCMQTNQEAGGEVREHKVDITDLRSISDDEKLPNLDESQKIQKRLDNSSSVKLFSVAALQQYTNSFSEENLIKECTFGKFYLAEHEKGMLYAVLMIKDRKSKIPVDDFLRLVEYISKIEHCNILELVGYCVEYGQRLLVYKYFSETTLSDVLHSRDHSTRTISLSWLSRIRVALEAAKVLEYLHGSAQKRIVHRQFASCNILLDDELRVCVLGCGLASSLPFISELQPDCFPASNASGNWSAKSDVYCFGVVLLELLTGHKPYDSSRPRTERYLAGWASCKLHDIDALMEMVDPALGGKFPIRSLSRVADIVSRCIQEEPEFRPSMSEVVQDLTQALNVDDGSSSIYYK